MNYVFGIDVGGTTVKLGLFKGDGTLFEKWEIKTRTENNGENVIPDIADSVKAKMKEKDIDKSQVMGIGVGVPGPVVNNTTVLECVNLGWGYTNVSEVLGNLLGISVVLGNDANVAALGEMWQGGGRGSKSICMVTLGTGVGGGVVIDEKIVTGSHGAAGEIGHITVNIEETELCNCGKPGCVEQYASATGIVRLAKNLLNESKEPSKLREYNKLSAKAIFDCAKEGDKLALELTDKFGQYLGLGLSFVASVVDPEVFVIGGGVSRAGNIIIDAVKKHYLKNVMKALKKTKFELAELGNDAGMYGCAKMVFD